MALSTYLIAGASAFGVLGVAPLTLPSTVHVERSAVIEAPAEALYALIASNAGYQTFNPYKSADPDLKITLQGPESGIGSGFAFDGKDGKGTQVVAAVRENQHVRMDIDLGAIGRPVQTFDLIPVSGGTRVTWGMDMDLGYNPVKRVFGLFMDRMMGKTYETGLANMARVVKAGA